MNFNTGIERRGTDSVKWDLAGRIHQNNEILPMWVADMDFAVPNAITDAIKKRAAHGIFGYTLQSDRMNEAIVQWYKRRHGVTLAQNWVIPTQGVVGGLTTILTALLQQGDGVIIMPPVYYVFSDIISKNGLTVKNNPLIFMNDTYVIDFEGFEKLCQEGAKACIFCNPHNPVGHVWSENEIKQLMHICQKYDILLISDEIHSDLVYNSEEFTSAFAESYDKLIVCSSPSKTFNLAGLHLGYALVANPALRQRILMEMEKRGIFGVNPLSQEALIAAYTYGEEWLEALKKYIFNNYLYLREFTAEKLPHVEVAPLEATYLVWLRLSHNKIAGVDIRKHLLNAGLWIEEGEMFGQGGENHIRINIACPRGTLEKGLAIFKEQAEYIWK